MSELELQRQEFEQKKKELFTRRSQLQEYYKQKEVAYQELNSLREKIHQKVNQLRSFKDERNNFTKKVKELKKEREQLHQVVKEKAAEKQQVVDKSKNLVGTAGVSRVTSRPENPYYLKDAIRRLESKLETEIMPFDKEKEIRKKIKEMQVHFAQLKSAETARREINTASADFSETRKKAQDVHETIQKLAQKSQGRHEELTKIAEEVKKMRQEEQVLADKHMQLKVEYQKAREELKQISARSEELAKLFHEDTEKSFKAKAYQRTEEVKEKIRTHKKLSMDDILAFQALKE